jgi:hypothetical protein
MSTDPVNYWQVICQCPHGHLLGTIIETRSGIGWYDHVLRDDRKVSGVPLTVGEKVKATCASCPRDRVSYGSDYQASWKRVAVKLQEARDTRSDAVTLVFG